MEDGHDYTAEFNEESQTKFEPERKKVSPYEDSPYVVQHPVEAPVQKPKKNGGRRWWKTAISIVLILLLVLSACAITAEGLNLHWQMKYELLQDVTGNRLSAMQEQLDAALGLLAPGVPSAPAKDALTPAQVYAKNVNAVVAVSSQTSSGSGFIISTDGYVVTNYHVIESGGALRVITSQKQEYTAQLVGYESSNDLALLKIKADNLPYVTIGSSNAVAVGDQVVAIGNPLGELTSTLTVGYVSAKDRVVDTEGTAMNMLQTDAAINSGNSGGPLFNMYGEVVGITTAKYTGSSSSGATIEGISFAIPVDDVAGMIEDLRVYGYVTGAGLGVMVRDVESAVVQYYGLPAGAYVDSVTPGSAAALAGVQARDIIVNLGGYNVTSISELTRVLRKFKAGDETTITVYRGGAEVHLRIILGEKPREDVSNEPVADATEPTYEDSWNNLFPPFFGRG